MRTQKIFIDADAFIALIKSDDLNHTKAKSIIHKLSSKDIQFLSSDYVFAEVVTVLSLRVSHTAAVAFIDNIKSEDSDIQILSVTSEIQNHACDIFKSQTSKNTSFMDCCHMACISYYKLDAVFSFDGIYKKNRILLATDLV